MLFLIKKGVVEKSKGWVDSPSDWSGFLWNKVFVFSFNSSLNVPAITPLNE